MNIFTNLRRSSAIAGVTVILLSLLATLPFGQSVSAFSGSGSGTLVDPYLVTSCAEFIEVSDELTAHYRLTADIGCSIDANNIIVDAGFSGSFDGDNHTIDVDIDSNGVAVIGLFTSVINGSLTNLSVSGSVDSDRSIVGMLAGRFTSSNASNLGSSGTVNGSDIVGGIFGEVCGSNLDSLSSTATSNGVDAVGGLIGIADTTCVGNGTLTNSTAAGNVSGTQQIGGAVGAADRLDIANVTATGSVSGQNQVGGLVGEYFGSGEDYKIFDSAGAGAVSGIGVSSAIGGLVGSLFSGIVSQSYSSSNVTGSTTTSSQVGGLIGTTGNSVRIYNTYATGIVTGNTEVGGLIGEMGPISDVYNSYATGVVNGSTALNAALVADNQGRVVQSYWDSDAVGVIDGCAFFSVVCDAVGRTTAQMQTQATFAGWNFTTVWAIDGVQNSGYPYFAGGAHEIITPPLQAGSTETSLSTNQFLGDGTIQSWSADDGFWEYDLPFDFTFYGVTYNKIYVSADGYIAFSDNGLAINDYSFGVVYGIGVPVIVALSANLDMTCGTGTVNPGQGIYISDTGNGRLVVRWDTADHVTCSEIYNFEVVLFDDSSFAINYGEMGLVDLVSNVGESGIHDGLVSFELSSVSGTANLNNSAALVWDRGSDDYDSVAPSTESAAPNSGDANDDGIADNEQSDVVSLTNAASGSYVVLDASAGSCTYSDSTSINQEADISTADAVYDYPTGLLNFTLNACDVGSTETITQYYFGDFELEDTVLRKYDAANGTYTNVPGVALSRVTIGGQSAVRSVYQVTDGGDLDSDGLANGVIVDPVGLGVVAPIDVASPDTGLQRVSLAPSVAAMVLGSTTIGFGVRAHRRRT